MDTQMTDQNDLDAEVIRDCGDCTFCCKMMGVSEMDKPPGKWCSECAIGVGCKIYDERPDGCRMFACSWAMSEEFPEALRPDRCKVMFECPIEDSQGHQMITLRVDPGRPLAYREPPVWAVIQVLRQHAKTDVIIICGKQVEILEAVGNEGTLFLKGYTEGFINISRRTG
jgi:hypothetical protein